MTGATHHRRRHPQRRTGINRIGLRRSWIHSHSGAWFLTFKLLQGFVRNAQGIKILAQRIRALLWITATSGFDFERPLSTDRPVLLRFGVDVMDVAELLSALFKARLFALSVTDGPAAIEASYW